MAARPLESWSLASPRHPLGPEAGAQRSAAFVLVAASLTACLAASLAACSDDGGNACEPGGCVEVSAECAPLYEPTFENVFERTLVPSCGVSGSACHGPDGAQAGLIFANIDEAYNLLTGATGEPSRVDPEALGCGALLARIASPCLNRVMPPMSPLPASEQCALIQWVAQGARR